MGDPEVFLTPETRVATVIRVVTGFFVLEDAGSEAEEHYHDDYAEARDEVERPACRDADGSGKPYRGCSGEPMNCLTSVVGIGPLPD